MEVRHPKLTNKQVKTLTRGFAESMKGAREPTTPYLSDFEGWLHRATCALWWGNVAYMPSISAVSEDGLGVLLRNASDRQNGWFLSPTKNEAFTWGGRGVRLDPDEETGSTVPEWKQRLLKLLEENPTLRPTKGFIPSQIRQYWRSPGLWPRNSKMEKNTEALSKIRYWSKLPAELWEAACHNYYASTGYQIGPALAGYLRTDLAAGRYSDQLSPLYRFFPEYAGDVDQLQQSGPGVYGIVTRLGIPSEAFCLIRELVDAKRPVILPNFVTAGGYFVNNQGWSTPCLGNVNALRLPKSEWGKIMGGLFYQSNWDGVGASPFVIRRPQSKADYGQWMDKVCQTLKGLHNLSTDALTSEILHEARRIPFFLKRGLYKHAFFRVHYKDMDKRFAWRVIRTHPNGEPYGGPERTSAGRLANTYPGIPLWDCYYFGHGGPIGSRDNRATVRNGKLILPEADNPFAEEDGGGVTEEAEEEGVTFWGLSPPDPPDAIVDVPLVYDPVPDMVVIENGEPPEPSEDDYDPGDFGDEEDDEDDDDEDNGETLGGTPHPEDARSALLDEPEERDEDEMAETRTDPPPTRMVNEAPARQNVWTTPTAFPSPWERSHYVNPPPRPSDLELLRDLLARYTATISRGQVEDAYRFLGQETVRELLGASEATRESVAQEQREQEPRREENR